MKWRILHGLVFITLAAAALIWLGDDLVLAVRLLSGQLSVGIAVAIMCFTLPHFLNEPLRWWVWMRGRRPRLTLTRTYHTLSVVALASYIAPVRVGIPARFVFFKRLLAMEHSTIASIMVVDALCAYGTWSVVAAAGVFLVLPHVGLRFPLAAALSAGIGVLLLIGRRRSWMQCGTVRRLADQFVGLTVAQGAVNTLLVACDVVCEGVRHLLILAAFGIDVSVVTVTLVTAMSVFAGFVSLMPLGLGAYDFSMAFLLGMVGVPREAAIAVPLINRAVTMGVGITLGAVSAGHLGLRPWALSTRGVGKARAARTPRR